MMVPIVSVSCVAETWSEKGAGMNSIHFLGAHGSRTATAQTTCIQLSPTTLIDAGNIMAGLGEAANLVERIFLTHAHLDHIIDLGFFIDHFFYTC